MSDRNNNIYIKDSKITRGEEALGYKKEAEASKIADEICKIIFWKENAQGISADITTDYKIYRFSGLTANAQGAGADASTKAVGANVKVLNASADGASVGVSAKLMGVNVGIANASAAGSYAGASLEIKAGNVGVGNVCVGGASADALAKAVGAQEALEPYTLWARNCVLLLKQLM